MINILLEGFDIDAPWLYDELKNYIKPNLSVAVVAFSFRDNRVKSLLDWNALYAKGCSKYHDGIVGGFTAYGIPEENVSFINYFTDTKETAAQKIKEIKFHINIDQHDYETKLNKAIDFLDKKFRLKILCFIRLPINIAVPSMDFSSTLPAKPSQTTTSTAPRGTSLASVLPTKLMMPLSPASFKKR